MNLSDLKSYEKNAKIHSKEQIEKISRAIEKYGFRQPIVINRENVIIIGHGRLEAAKKLGFKEIRLGVSQAKKKEKFIPVIVVDDLTEKEIKELRIADNKLNESPWDMEVLNFSLHELSADFHEIIDVNIENIKTEKTENAKIKHVFEIVIECEDEKHQEEKYNELMQMGFNCRLISM